MLGQLAYFLVAYAIFAGVIVFLMTFGRSPVFAGTIVERASEFVAGGCCSSILNLIQRICGSAVAQRVDSVIDYCMWQKNPILPATYFLTVAACFFLYYYRVFSWFPTSMTPVWHKYTGTASVILCCLMWFRVYLSNPGLITKDNVYFWLAADPPGDDLYPTRDCSTCELPKPARSKHCSLCKGCIAREDHHCGWIANCVGALNFRYFLGFIFANIVMMWYGAVLAFATMWGVLKDAGLLDRPFFVRPGYKVRLRDDKVALVRFAMRKFTILPAISVFLGVAAIVVSCFFAFNAWNISWGLTGNDRHKLSELNRKIVLESRAESYVTDSPREKPTPKRISYSKGFFRNWLEILLPGTIRAAGSAATHSVPESSTKGNNARKYGTRKKKKQ